MGLSTTHRPAAATGSQKAILPTEGEQQSSHSQDSGNMAGNFQSVSQTGSSPGFAGSASMPSGKSFEDISGVITGVTVQVQPLSFSDFASNSTAAHQIPTTSPATNQPKTQDSSLENNFYNQLVNNFKETTTSTIVAISELPVVTAKERKTPFFDTTTYLQHKKEIITQLQEYNKSYDAAIQQINAEGQKKKESQQQITENIGNFKKQLSGEITTMQQAANERITEPLSAGRYIGMKVAEDVIASSLTSIIITGILGAIFGIPGVIAGGVVWLITLMGAAVLQFTKREEYHKEKNLHQDYEAVYQNLNKNLSS